MTENIIKKGQISDQQQRAVPAPSRSHPHTASLVVVDFGHPYIYLNLHINTICSV